MKMPDLSTTDSAIKLVRWLVLPGQSVKRGQSLCEVETDKAASEVESIATGVLKEFRAQPGDMLVAGQELALFETETRRSVRPPLPPWRSAKGLGLFARNRAAVPAPGPSPAIALSQSQQTAWTTLAGEQAKHPALLFAGLGQCRADDPPPQHRNTEACLGGLFCLRHRQSAQGF
jgi:pyruvate/2-oxoglutarate dehydrogenase complex dihydrolipoamide acyltransferase (E2) component